ncbi:MAG: sugar ABC transporter permease [Verrucomicrobia bacterium]|nr:sugar ABC transporter permease [Verrucomicrobiota bacterium]MBV9275451.1 sugar ABC transporter permease [Verrucomicrobiota bacterium]
MAVIASAQSKAERGFKYALLAPAVIWVIGLTFFPIVAAVHFSFVNYVLGEGITGFVGFDNYVRVLTDGGFWYSIFITLVYVLVTVPIEVCAGFVLAWIITIGLPGKSFFRPILTAPLFTMEVAIGYLGVTLFTDQGGLVTTLLAAVGIHIEWLSTGAGGLAAAMILDMWIWTPFVFLMSLAGLSAIPNDIYDAAMLEASSHWEVFRHVALPLAWPVLTIAILLRIIEGMKSFGLPYALTSGGPGTSTQLFSIMADLTTIQFTDFGRGSAMGVLYLILVSVVITIFFKQMRKRIE